MSFLTNLRQKEFMRWGPWFFGCCVLWGAIRTLNHMWYARGFDFQYWSDPVLKGGILLGAGVLYWGLSSKFSCRKVMVSFPILYGLLQLNLNLYGFFKIDPPSFVLGITHIVSEAWIGLGFILIYTGVNRFLDVKTGMRFYPILIVLMNVAAFLGPIGFGTFFDFSPSPVNKWFLVVLLFGMAFVLKKFLFLPETQKKEISHPSLSFSRFIFGIFVLVLAFVHVLPTVWRWCTKWAVYEGFHLGDATSETWGQLLSYGAWTSLAALPILLGITLWIVFYKRWQTLLWTWAGLLGAAALALMIFPPMPSEVVAKSTLIGMNLVSAISTSILFITLTQPVYLAFPVEVRTKFKPFCDSIAIGLATILASIWNTWGLFLDANPVVMAAALTICVALFGFWGLKTVGKHLKLEDYS